LFALRLAWGEQQQEEEGSFGRRVLYRGMEGVKEQQYWERESQENEETREKKKQINRAATKRTVLVACVGCC